MNADAYLEHWKKNKVWTHLEWPKHQTRLRRCTELAAGRTFLDFGCACGHSTKIMSGFLPGAWTGLDMSAEAIMTAGAIFPDLNFIWLPNLSWAQDAGRFDTVICSEVLEHVPDQNALIYTLEAAAKKRIVLTTPNKRVSDPGHLRLHTRDSLADLFKDFDAEILEEAPFFFVVLKLERGEQ